MEMYAEDRKTSELKGGLHMLNDRIGPERHIPPHERKALMRIEFDKRDIELLKKIFGDEDTAMAAAEIIKEAPPEIQILAIQLMNIIEEVA